MNNSSGHPVVERPRILLVEDDAGVRRSLQLLLQAKGFDVRAHATGGTLLSDPLSDGATCFIADYRMENLDGLQVMAKLRARGWTGPAILITAFPSAELTEQANMLGFDAIIEKPFREHIITDTVERLLASHEPPTP